MRRVIVGGGIAGRDALRALPAGHVMGVPPDPATLEGTGLLSEAGLARLREEERLPAPPLPAGDPSVAEYPTWRLGREAVDRLVEPLLGGVYAGEVDRLSLRSAPGPWPRSPGAAARCSRRCGTGPRGRPGRRYAA
ncbi:hypothetical protein [Streptomyces sp. NPDC085466]|uniref:hypothetical protein n=1 Tax=Streptomyces sp. NPDC085466 TaxID=3365725 RepID=UPI0037D6F774